MASDDMREACDVRGGVSARMKPREARGQKRGAVGEARGAGDEWLEGERREVREVRGV